ncbi:MAG: 16S rRNA (cytidine(1402)-2'-O)-methyltransferase [Halothiobacillaceae bacterium]|nr:16S rRNA (cytidine(1402)-2'-O)-methyltransferase [Halothiobacillaceae bacterium]
MNPAVSLYIVATPLGNLEDMSPRACRVLGEVDVVAAEDTRHTRKLMQHFAINTTLVSLHEHNERERAGELVGRMRAGETVALVSDAGTPLVSDPGFHLVRLSLEAGLSVSPIPGPSAMIAALSVAGLPSDRFCFEGFPPARRGARREFFDSLRGENRTVVFYESPHRLLESLHDLRESWGEARRITLARELTKLYETVRQDSLSGLCEWMEAHPEQVRGECVLVVEGAALITAGEVFPEQARVMIRRLLSAGLSVRDCAEIAQEVFSLARKPCYREALELAGEKG